MSTAPRTFETELRGQISRIAGKKYVCFEEGPASQGLVEILSPHVEQILISTRRRKRESSNDRSDALELANAIRVGSISERVTKPTPELLRLRSRGITAPSGDSAFWALKYRDEWIAKLPERVRDSGLLLFAELDALTHLRREALKLLAAELPW